MDNSRYYYGPNTDEGPSAKALRNTVIGLLIVLVTMIVCGVWEFTKPCCTTPIVPAQQQAFNDYDTEYIYKHGWISDTERRQHDRDVDARKSTPTFADALIEFFDELHENDILEDSYGTNDIPNASTNDNTNGFNSIVDALIAQGILAETDVSDTNDSSVITDPRKNDIANHNSEKIDKVRDSIIEVFGIDVNDDEVSNAADHYEDLIARNRTSSNSLDDFDVVISMLANIPSNILARIFQ